MFICEIYGANGCTLFAFTGTGWEARNFTKSLARKGDLIRIWYSNHNIYDYIEM